MFKLDGSERDGSEKQAVAGGSHVAGPVELRHGELLNTTKVMRAASR